MNKIAFWSNMYQKINFKKDTVVEAQDHLCDSCFRMELDGRSLNDLGLQWGFGVTDPTSQTSNMCNECFKLELDENNLALVKTSELSCMQCGIRVESENNLLSSIKGVCNHCFLVVANKDHSCIRCDPSFPIPQEARDE